MCRLALRIRNVNQPATADAGGVAEQREESVRPRGSFEAAVGPPTAGKRHPHTEFANSHTDFWRDIRYLARTILHIGDIAENDAYALFGNVVLDPGRSGSAKNVTIRPEFGRWVLRTIRDDLRPRYLICLGMNRKRDAGMLLAEAFRGFDPTKPRCEHVFLGYERKQFKFREWDVENSSGEPIKIVYWPQHPSQSPFKNSFNTWQAACEEFADRHGGFIRP